MEVPSFRMPRSEICEDLNRIRHPFRIALERAKNPFNIGAIIRTAHSFLVEEIILIGTEPWYERAAMGMQRYENLVELETSARFIESARKQDWKLIAFEREHARVGVWDYEFPTNSVLMFGNEDTGLSPDLLEAADEVVAIPMFGINHSYPVTVAAGIAMSEWTRRYYQQGRVITPKLVHERVSNS